MTELEQYIYDSGWLAHEDMLRDRKFQHLGVAPLWNDANGAWLWFSSQFLENPAENKEQFMKGWEDYGQEILAR